MRLKIKGIKFIISALAAASRKFSKKHTTSSSAVSTSTSASSSTTTLTHKTTSTTPKMEPMSPYKSASAMSRPLDDLDMQNDQRHLHFLPPPARPSPLTAISPRPIPNSYWATPLLLACEYPWTPKNPYKPKLDNLLKAGVRTFVDLTECGELLSYTNLLCSRAELWDIDPEEIEYHRFPIRDRSLPESVNYMQTVFEVLHDNERRGRICAVHCRGGIGRTGLVIGCWLVESGVAKNGEEALARIAREWRTVEKCKRYPHSPETGPQFEFVRNFHADHRPGVESGSDSEEEMTNNVAKEKAGSLPLPASTTVRTQPTSPREGRSRSSSRSMLKKLRSPGIAFGLGSFQLHTHST